MEKYIPIPQWIWKNNDIVGVKDLFLVHTCESDYWIKKKCNKYQVYDCNIRERLLICESMEEAMEHIRENAENNRIFWTKLKEQSYAKT